MEQIQKFLINLGFSPVLTSEKILWDIFELRMYLQKGATTQYHLYENDIYGRGFETIDQLIDYLCELYYFKIDLKSNDERDIFTSFFPVILKKRTPDDLNAPYYVIGEQDIFAGYDSENFNDFPGKVVTLSEFVSKVLPSLRK